MREQVLDNAQEMHEVIRHCSKEVRQLGDSSSLDGRRTKRVIEDLQLTNERKIQKLERQIEEMKIRNTYLRDEVQRERTQSREEVDRLTRHYEDKIAAIKGEGSASSSTAQGSLLFPGSSALSPQIQTQQQQQQQRQSSSSSTHNNNTPPRNYFASRSSSAPQNNQQQQRTFSSASSVVSISSPFGSNATRNQNINNTNNNLKLDLAIARARTNDLSNNNNNYISYHHSMNPIEREFSPAQKNRQLNNQHQNKHLIEQLPSTKTYFSSPTQLLLLEQRPVKTITSNHSDDDKVKREVDRLINVLESANQPTKRGGGLVTASTVATAKEKNSFVDPIHLSQVQSKNNGTANANAASSSNSRMFMPLNMSSSSNKAPLSSNDLLNRFKSNNSNNNNNNNYSASTSNRPEDDRTPFSPPGSRISKKQLSTEESVIERLITDYRHRHHHQMNDEDHDNGDVRRESTLSQQHQDSPSRTASNFQYYSPTRIDDDDDDEETIGNTNNPDDGNLTSQSRKHTESISKRNPAKKSGRKSENNNVVEDDLQTDLNQMRYSYGIDKDDETNLDDEGATATATNQQHYSPPPRSMKTNSNHQEQHQQPTHVTTKNSVSVNNNNIPRAATTTSSMRHGSIAEQEQQILKKTVQQPRQQQIITVISKRRNSVPNSIVSSATSATQNMSDWAKRELELRHEEQRRLAHGHHHEVLTDAFERKTAFGNGAMSSGGGVTAVAAITGRGRSTSTSSHQHEHDQHDHLRESKKRNDVGDGHDDGGDFSSLRRKSVVITKVKTKKGKAPIQEHQPQQQKQQDYSGYSFARSSTASGGVRLPV